MTLFGKLKIGNTGRKPFWATFRKPNWKLLSSRVTFTKPTWTVERSDMLMPPRSTWVAPSAMFRKLAAVALTLVLVAGIVAVGSLSADAQRNVKWEYQIIGMRLQPRSEVVDGKKILTARGMATEFNFQGDQGWEFVDTIPGEEDAYFVVFRRRK